MRRLLAQVHTCTLEHRDARTKKVCATDCGQGTGIISRTLALTAAFLLLDGATVDDVVGVKIVKEDESLICMLQYSW
jgi:hypothetical protein